MPTLIRFGLEIMIRKVDFCSRKFSNKIKVNYGYRFEKNKNKTEGGNNEQ
jgi:hypothetical protein